MITIVTDSSSYFKEAEALQMGLRIVPINYMVNNKAYLESFSDYNIGFESLLEHGAKMSTSQPNSSAFLKCFEEEAEKNNEILCITLSSRLSGTYSAACAAAKQIGGQGIAVFDSRLIAGGLYLLITRANQLIKAGHKLTDIIPLLEQIRGKISITFSVGNIDPLRRSGRIGFVRMNAETILNVKPVLQVKEGAVVLSGMARGSANLAKKLLHAVDANASEVVINYIGEGRLATNLYHILETNYPNLPVSLRKGGPVLGIQLGLNAIAVSFVRMENQQ